MLGPGRATVGSPSHIKVARGAEFQPQRARRPTPTRTPVGTISELWRYPVKSMLGATLSEIVVTPNGFLGDRAWALRDIKSGRIASAKKFPRLLEFRATYEVEPTLKSPGRVRIETPDGDAIYPEDPNASRVISELLGRDVRLENQAREDEKTTIDRETVFGDVALDEMKSDWSPELMADWTSETMPDYFQLKKNTFFEIGSVFVLASGSVEHLLELQGGTALIDRRRFRPNVFIETPAQSGRFVEDDWLGFTLAVGDELILDEFQPTLWCVTSTLAQEELPRDLSILRTTAENHKGCLGVYASVRSPGLARIGDPVVLFVGKGTERPLDAG
jgi:uncharacterized protein YcbX